MYPVLAYAQIKANILRDIANLSPDAYVGDDGDYAIRASGEAAAIEGLYAHQQWIYKQIFPDLMDFDQLQLFGADRGLTLKPATAATATATFGGVAGSAIPLGTLAVVNGISYATTANAIVGIGGTVNVPIAAVLVGLAGNLTSGAVLNLSAPPAGINTTITLFTAATGGTDTETQASFLARILYRLQNPPQGGSAADYYLWATNTPGCGYAYIYGQRWASNSVDIVILDSNGALPTLALIAAVQANINANRPVCANNSVVESPNGVPVDISATLTRAPGVLLANIQPFIFSTLQAYFLSLIPGQTVVYNELVNLIMSVTGVRDVVFTSPIANLPMLVNAAEIQLPILGTVTLS